MQSVRHVRNKNSSSPIRINDSYTYHRNIRDRVNQIAKLSNKKKNNMNNIMRMHDQRIKKGMKAVNKMRY
jgi:hypothetical protein